MRLAWSADEVGARGNEFAYLQTSEFIDGRQSGCVVTATF